MPQAACGTSAPGVATRASAIARENVPKAGAAVLMMPRANPAVAGAGIAIAVVVVAPVDTGDPLVKQRRSALEEVVAVGAHFRVD